MEKTGSPPAEGPALGRALQNDPPAPEEARCTCDHPESAHQHYRKGTDCSLCARGDCKRFRQAAESG